MHRPGLKDILLLALVCAVWGSSFAAIRVAVQGVPPSTVAFGRIFIAALVLVIANNPARKAWPKQPRTWGVLALVGLLSAVLPYFFLSWAEQSVTSVEAGILFAMGPLLAIVVTHILSKDERITLNRMAGLLIGFAGVAFVLTTPESRVETTLQIWLARLAVVACPVGYALAGNLARRVADVEPDVITTVAFLCAAPMIASFSLISDQPWQLQPDALQIGAVIYLALLPTAWGFLVRFRQIAQFGYTFVSFAGYLVPVFAVTWGMLLLGESLDVKWIGALVLILVGLWVSKSSASREASWTN
jgi:drug/metabolite transporter (DMT)-like permease